MTEAQFLEAVKKSNKWVRVGNFMRLKVENKYLSPTEGVAYLISGEIHLGRDANRLLSLNKMTAAKLNTQISYLPKRIYSVYEEVLKNERD